MAFNEIEMARYKREVTAYIENKRPPASIRGRLDFDFRIEGQSVEVFEIQPRWDDPREKIEVSVAKATYVKSTIYGSCIGNAPISSGIATSQAQPCLRSKRFWQ